MQKGCGVVQPQVTVVGAGLAGTEAAWQLARRGVRVTLIDMKPHKRSPAHAGAGFAELVCSNSLKGARVTAAPGLLKQEMRTLRSLIIEAADNTRVPAGGSLSVDRGGFSAYVTRALFAHPNITVLSQEVTTLPDPPVVIATGPLTSDALAAAIAERTGEALHFFDAAAPIIERDSVDFVSAFYASRYGKGDDDYINCPMDREEYLRFHAALIAAETAPVHGLDGEPNVFEGCMPVEVMAGRGVDTLRFGPLKPVGLSDPRTGRRPYAVLQLRQDDASASLYNLVGCQTRLKFPEQRRVFGMIPALKNAAFARYGVMHRNTYLRSPGLLDKNFRMESGFYFAGQMTGVEGYTESAASGLIAGIALAAELRGEDAPDFPGITMLGALSRYISTPNRDFQPMNANFGILDPLDQRIRGKQERYTALAARSLAWMREKYGPVGC
jgi:methylenetetrahydrofolate--tRNA-(uracil-5-)-methyltransferase